MRKTSAKSAHLAQRTARSRLTVPPRTRRCRSSQGPDPGDRATPPRCWIYTRPAADSHRPDGNARSLESDGPDLARGPVAGVAHDRGRHHRDARAHARPDGGATGEVAPANGRVVLRDR